MPAIRQCLKNGLPHRLADNAHLVLLAFLVNNGQVALAGIDGAANAADEQAFASYW